MRRWVVAMDARERCSTASLPCGASADEAPPDLSILFYNLHGGEQSIFIGAVAQIWVYSF